MTNISKIILLIMLAVLIASFVFTYSTQVCFCGKNASAAENPYCTKCGQQGDLETHTCTNPNGIDKYCPVCGKITSEYIGKVIQATFNK